MPQKTVFIRDGDLDKWNSIEKKSEFIHNALSPISTYKQLAQKDLCKIHGLPLDTRGRCLQKGCKYA